MKINNTNFKFSQLICLFLYYQFAQYLPVSYSFWGRILHSKTIRYNLCKYIFKSIGKNVNIERKACFGSGRNLEISDNSGLGINCVVPSNIKIGADVMMGPNVHIFSQNHSFERTDIPMWKQGYKEDYSRTIIEDDVWIGQNVTFTVGRHVAKGSIIGTCTLLCKDFPEYSIIGGNPSKLIKSRLKNI